MKYAKSPWQGKSPLPLLRNPTLYASNPVDNYFRRSITLN